MPQIMARSRHLILKNYSKWNEQQKARSKVLFKAYPVLEKAYDLSMRLTDKMNKKVSSDLARLHLARWFNDVQAMGLKKSRECLKHQ